MTPLQLGLFMTVIASSGVLASTWAGKWSDRHGHHRELLLAALSASAIGFICLCLVHNYVALLVIGGAFLGAGGSAISLLFSFGRFALPVRDNEERTFATASLRTVLSGAWVFGPSVGALILAASGFYGLFLFAAASFAACGVIVIRTRKPTNAAFEAEAASETTTEHFYVDPVPGATAEAEAFAEATEANRVTRATGIQPTTTKPPALWRAIAALTLLGLAANATMIVLPLYIVRGMHGTQIDVSIMLGLGAFLEIPMMLALGARGAKVNKVRWLAASAGVHLLYFIGVAAVWNVTVLIPMQALSAFVVAVTSCLGMTYVQDLMPRSPGAATALFFNSARVGSILSGVLSGMLVGAIGYRGTFLCCGVLAAGALWLFANPQWEFLQRWRQRD